VLILRSAAANEDRSPREDEPADDGDGGEDSRNQVTEQRGGCNGASEGSEVRDDVVDGRDKALIDDVRDGDEHAAGEGHGQENAHHRRSLAELGRARRL
jgi:hypothetical protein